MFTAHLQSIPVLGQTNELGMFKLKKKDGSSSDAQMNKIQSAFLNSNGVIFQQSLSSIEKSLPVISKIARLTNDQISSNKS